MSFQKKHDVNDGWQVLAVKTSDMAEKMPLKFVLAAALMLAGSSWSQAAPDAAAAAAARLDLASLPLHAWVEISASRKPDVQHASIWYLRATDEFFLWGANGRHRFESKAYEVQTLRLDAGQPEWTESFPLGKEQAWANGKFPNWGCGCHQLTYTPDRPWRKDVRDEWVGPHAAINRIRFVEMDGVTRPTRVFANHQAAYDSKRGRLVYFTGGKTFAYDPRTRQWLDLNAVPPLCCEALAWASMCYDVKGDQIVLFGGTYALNPWGGARTWLFDCAKNEWHRPEIKDGLEPPLRCNTQLVYDSKQSKVVMFGGDALDRWLADTWVFDPSAASWREMKPALSPPPNDRWTGCYIEKHGLVFYAMPTRRNGRDMRAGEAWAYDLAKNLWIPLKGRMPGDAVEWLSADYSRKDDVIVLFAPQAGTWAYRLDPATARDDQKRQTAVPGEWVWNGRGGGQTTGVLAAPAGDRAGTEAKIKALPANTVVDAAYPGDLTSKTWSTAAMDTDRGVVIYVGGGHCGYKGTDYALYDVGINRWAFDRPPCFIPFLYDYNEVIYGWDYYMRPQAQHTYRWYAYDPVSKLVVYCARPAGPYNGFKVQLTEEAVPFVYDDKQHGTWTFLYHPASNTRYPPVFGRPFGNGWAMALCGTPKGVFARAGGNLYLAQATRDAKQAGITWTLVDKDAPGGAGEFQPLIFDSKRERLLLVAAAKEGAPLQVWEHPLTAGPWQELALKNAPTRISREIVYDVKNDCLVAMPSDALLVMDCRNNTWQTLDVAMPKGAYNTECAMVYDPVHEVCVMLVPTGFSARMGVYLFRYDPITAKVQAN